MVIYQKQAILHASQQPQAVQGHPHANDVAGVLAAAIQAVDPRLAVANCLHRQGHLLTIGPITYNLQEICHLKVIGVGKAARPMLQGVADVLGDRLDCGCVITKHAASEDDHLGPIRIVEGSHPVPDEKSVAAARQMIASLGENHPNDLIICLISGGGSALMMAPIEGVRLADMQALTSSLLACGATINEINALRKHLDAVKGGGLARICAPAQLACLILSDVVGSPLDVIASGPAVPDPSTFADCWQIVTRYELEANLPTAIRAALQAGRAGELPETLKAGDPIFARTQNLLVGSNPQAAQAALDAARQAGYHTLLLTTYLQGEARKAGQFLAAIARQIAENGQPVPRPACIVVGGETTVTIRGDGLGGRNQELALGAVRELSGLPNCLLVTCATDGEDGPTDAAGAFVSGETLVRARQRGLDPASFLQANDSYHFFQALGDLFSPGPTGTNVNDLAFLWLF
jgi:hydroxypyruvate reductase